MERNVTKTKLEDFECGYCHTLNSVTKEEGELLEYSLPEEELWCAYTLYKCNACGKEDFTQ
jgi:hypothetical protein